MTEIAPSSRFDLARAWTIDPRVALRPESFGALAYHFGTRGLSFLKSRRLLAVVQQLGEHPTGWDACRAADVPEAEIATYEAALARLADTGMICERERR